jgi:hypothetical protein
MRTKTRLEALEKRVAWLQQEVLRLYGLLRVVSKNAVATDKAVRALGADEEE